MQFGLLLCQPGPVFLLHFLLAQDKVETTCRWMRFALGDINLGEEVELDGIRDLLGF